LLFHRITGAGRPLVFIHGWGVSSSVWKKQVDRFSKKFRVITVCLPGHGGASPVSGRLTIQRCAGMLSDLLKERDLRGAHLVGWSLGGQIAVRAALELGGEFVKSITVVGGTPCYVAPSESDKWAVHPTRARYFQRKLKDDFRAALGYFIMSFFEAETGLTEDDEKEIRSLFFDDSFPPDEKSAMELLKSLYEDDIRAELDGMETPCLICHGQRDMIVPVEVTNLWTTLLKSAETVTFEECGHAPFLSRPSVFSAALTSFLGRFA